MLVLAGGCTALWTRRHWVACDADPSASDCLVLRDESYDLPVGMAAGQPVLADALLVVAAALLLGLAWLTVLDWARASAARMVVAVMIALQPVLVAAVEVLQLATSSPVLLTAAGWLTWPAEMLVIPLLLGAGWILDEAPGQVVRLMLLAWAVTSFGPLHHFVDYVLSSVLLDGLGARPPGLGYVTAFTQVGCGLLVLVATMWLETPGEPEEGDERTGRDGFSLAA
jgi:hypothetical protein